MGATLFRFESCRAHHVELKQVPNPRGLVIFVGGRSGGLGVCPILRRFQKWNSRRVMGEARKRVKLSLTESPWGSDLTALVYNDPDAAPGERWPSVPGLAQPVFPTSRESLRPHRKWLNIAL